LFDEFVAAICWKGRGDAPGTLHQLRIRHGDRHPPGSTAREVPLTRDHHRNGDGAEITKGCLGSVHRSNRCGRNPHPRFRIRRNRHRCAGQSGHSAAGEGRGGADTVRPSGTGHGRRTSRPDRPLIGTSIRRGSSRCHAGRRGCRRCG
jgi:hypothetical protein